MSGFELTARLVSALAWPVAVAILLVVLRRPVSELLTSGAQRLKRVRVGPVEAEWHEQAAQATAELVASTVATNPELGAQLRRHRVIEHDPLKAVTEGIEEVDQTLREMLLKHGVEVPADKDLVGPMALVRIARENGLVEEATVRSIDGVSVMSNLAMSDPRGVTGEQALEFRALVDAVLYVLRGSQQ
jgi:hypothetical protein